MTASDHAEHRADHRRGEGQDQRVGEPDAQQLWQRGAHGVEVEEGLPQRGQDVHPALLSVMVRGLRRSRHCDAAEPLPGLKSAGISRLG